LALKKVIFINFKDDFKIIYNGKYYYLFSKKHEVHVHASFSLFLLLFFINVVLVTTVMSLINESYCFN